MYFKVIPPTKPYFSIHCWFNLNSIFPPLEDSPPMQLGNVINDDDDDDDDDDDNDDIDDD